MTAIYLIGRSKRNSIKITKIGSHEQRDYFEVAYTSDGAIYHHRGLLTQVADWLSMMMFVGGGTIEQVKTKLKHLSGDDVLALV